MAIMKHLFQSSAVIAAALCSLTLTATAAEIRLGSYEYDYGKVAAALKGREVFVISEGSLIHQRLTLKPKTVSLAVRTSEVQTVKNINTAAETTTENISSAKQTTVADTVGRPSVAHMCLLPVYFRFDQSELSDFEKKHLDLLADSLKGRSPQELLQIRVTGYTCDLGSKDYNNRLSLLRAKSVAAYLESKGLKPLEVRGEGNNKPLSEVRSANRRVEIDIVR